MKFNIYSDGDFLDNVGAPYVGLLHTENGKAYSGSSPNSVRIELTPTDSYNAYVILSDFQYDRTVNDPIILPNSFSDIVLNTELINNQNVNDSIKKLYNNLAYLYSNTQITNTDYKSDLYMLSGNGWKGMSTLTGYNQIINKEFTDYKTRMFMTRNAFYIQIFFNKNRIQVFRYEQPVDGEFLPDNWLQLEDTNLYDNFSDLKLLNISDIVILGDNMFVLDESRSTIYQYDIRLIINDDLDTNTGSQIIKFLNKVQGGVNAIKDGVILSKPKHIFTDGINVYVYDDKFKDIKVFDRNLSLVDLIRNNTINTSTKKIIYHEQLDNFIIVESDKVVFTNTKLEIIKTYSGAELKLFNNNKKLGEIVDIDISKYDPNIIYIGCVYNNGSIVFKKKISKISSNMRIINLFDITLKSINNGDVLPISTVERVALFLSCTSNVNINGGASHTDVPVVYATTDTTETFNLLDTNNIKIFSQDECLIKNEIITSFTFNKIFYKLLYNHYILINSITKKVIYDINDSSIVTGQRTRPLADIDYLNVKNINDYNFYIGDNEVVGELVINRCLCMLYNLQVDIINILLSEFNIAPLNLNLLID